MKKVLIFYLLISFFSDASAQNTGVDSSFFTVRLSSFEISLEPSNLVKLHWKTVCFLQFANFELQKSFDGVNFTTFHTLIADRLRCQEAFEFVDSATQPNRNVYYRISAGNIEGKFFSSSIKFLALKDRSFKVYPLAQSIVSSNLSFSVAHFDSKPISIVIYNNAGILVKTIQLASNRGISTINISTNNLTSGLYYLKIQKSQTEPIVFNFIKL